MLNARSGVWVVDLGQGLPFQIGVARLLLTGHVGMRERRDPKP